MSRGLISGSDAARFDPTLRENSVKGSHFTRAKKYIYFTKNLNSLWIRILYCFITSNRERTQSFEFWDVLVEKKLRFVISNVKKIFKFKTIFFNEKPFRSIIFEFLVKSIDFQGNFPQSLIGVGRVRPDQANSTRKIFLQQKTK